MGNAILQELAAQYASGSIDKATYRQQRKQLINEITGYQEPPAHIATPPPDIRRPEQPVDNNSRIAIALVAILISIIILAYFTWPDKQKARTPEHKKPANSFGEKSHTSILNNDQCFPGRLNRIMLCTTTPMLILKG